MTNLFEIPAETVVTIYKKRGTMETFIKEIKNGFFFNKTASHFSLENETRMLFSCIPYNIMMLFKQLTFPKTERTSTISTIRFKLLHLASKITKHAKKIHIHLTSTNIFNELFWQVLYRIQNLEISA